MITHFNKGTAIKLKELPWVVSQPKSRVSLTADLLLQGEPIQNGFLEGLCLYPV